MSVTVFGIIWILLLMYSIYEKGVKVLVYLLLFSAVLQCDNILVLGDTVGIGPQIITSIVFIIKSYFYVNPNKIHLNSKIIFLCFPWLVISAVIIISSYLNHVLNIAGLRILQLLFYVWCYIRLFKVFKYQKNIEVNKIFRHLMWFVVVCGGFQFLMSFGILPKFKLFSLLLFNETNNSAVFFYNSNVKRLFSTFMEASYCSPFLVGSFYFLLYDIFSKNKKKSDICLLIIIFIEILLTFSATAYAVFAIGGCLFLLLLKQKQFTIYKITLVIIGAIAVCAFYPKLESMVNTKLESGSGVARTGLNKRGLLDYTKSPIYGVGFKNSRSSSLITTVLGELGGVGIASYFAFLFSNIKSFLKKEISWFKKYFLILSCVIIAQIISIPDLEFCVFWLFMNICALAYSKELYGNTGCKIVNEAEAEGE